MIHFDTKLPNMLLSANGIVKQTDFGLTKVGTQVGLSNRVGDNAKYQAPEIFDADLIARANAEAFLKEKHGLDPILSPGKKSPDKKAQPQAYNDFRAQSLAHEGYESRVKHLMESNMVDRKSDTWAVGVAVHELFIGNINKLNWNSQFQTEITDKLKEPESVKK